MQLSLKRKKGAVPLSQAAPLVIVLLTIGIVVTTGLLIMAEVDEEVQETVNSGAGCNDTENIGTSGSCYGYLAYNATLEAQEGIDTLSSFQSIFGIIVAAVIVLGLIVLFR